MRSWQLFSATFADDTPSDGSQRRSCITFSDLYLSFHLMKYLQVMLYNGYIVTDRRPNYKRATTLKRIMDFSEFGHAFVCAH